MLNIATNFAQVSTNCTINGQPTSCSQVENIIVPLLLGIFVPLTIIFVVLMIFWVKSLIHLINHQDVPNRTLWIILHFIILGPLAGVIYLIFVKKPYDKQHVTVPINNTPPPQSPTFINNA